MNHLSRTVLAALAAVLGLTAVVLQPAGAAAIDIASIPVASTGASMPAPNIMLLMDTSQSMSYTHMPDGVDNFQPVQTIGYTSAQCNNLYYDPTRTYSVPVDASQQPLPTPSFGNAPYDTYTSTTSTSGSANIDLSKNFQAYDWHSLTRVDKTGKLDDTPQPAYYYVYTGGGTPINYATAPCTSMALDIFPAGADFTKNASAPVAFVDASGNAQNGTWTRVVVNSNSGVGGVDERTNFAIWYTYYRTRIAMVKSSVSSAFAPMTNKFRIGFITVNPMNKTTNAQGQTVVDTGASMGVDTAAYLGIDFFTAQHKKDWYSKLLSQVPNGSSPTREGLARVGRHYAGMKDGINANMTPDPVTNSCQQNFTILTTDGYWNVAGETPQSAGGGPVMIDSTKWVGNQDGVLTPETSLDNTDPTKYSHRPIWDGTTSGTRIDTNQTQQQRYANCVSNQYYMTTSSVMASTSQLRQRTQQLTQSTAQNLASTSQISRTTSQPQQTTSSATVQTLQNLATTQSQTKSTRQETQKTTIYPQSTSVTSASTKQILETDSYTNKQQNTLQKRTVTINQVTARMLQSTSQVLQTTVQNNLSTSQVQQSTYNYQQTVYNTYKTTAQTNQTTTAWFQSTAQALQTTSNYTKSVTNTQQATAQNLATTTTILKSTSQPLRSTASYTKSVSSTLIQTLQTLQTQTIAYQSTLQYLSYDGTTEIATAVPSCTSGGNISCIKLTTGPTKVANCTPGTDGSYVTTTCTSTVVSGPAPVQSCTPSAGNSGNGFVTTACTTNNSTPTAAASCTNAAGAQSNNWVTTVCTQTTPVVTPNLGACSAGTSAGVVTSCTKTTLTSNVPVASCTAGTTATTETTCTNAATGPSAVGSCTPGTDASFVTTTCNTSVVGPTPVQTCTPAAAGSGNGYVATACTTNNTPPTNVASCTGGAGTALNNWVTTTCTQTTPTVTTVAACTPGTTSGVTTACTQNILSGPTPVQTCTPGTSGTTATTCTNNNTPSTAVASCTPVTAASPSWTTTSCTSTVKGPTPVQTCTAAAANSGNSFVATTCTPNNTGPTTVPTACTAASPTAPNWITTTCTQSTPVVTTVASCTASSTGGVVTTCGTKNVLTTNVPVQTCTASTTGTTAVVCTPVNTGPTPTPAASCASSPATAPNWITTTCTPTTVGPAAVQTCTAAGPTSGNKYTTTTCTPVTTGPTAVATCTPSAASSPNWVTTTCAPDPAAASTTPVAACTPQTASAANNYVTITCPTTDSGWVAAATCTAASPTAGNGYQTVTCQTIQTLAPTAVLPANCTAGTVGAVTTTCTPVVKTDQPVASCTPNAVGPVFTTCRTVTTGPTPVASCTPNTDVNQVVTTCSTSTPVVQNVQACTPSGPTSANGYTTTTCPSSPPTTVGVAPGTCKAQTATALNNWVTIECPAAVTTGPTPVALGSCTPIPATFGSNFVATTCATTGPTVAPVQSCTASTDPTTLAVTTCSTNNSAVQTIVPGTCTPVAASSANQWTQTVCSGTVSTTIPVAAGTCTPSAAGVAPVITCPAPVTTGPTFVTSCTPGTDGNFVTTACSVATTGPTPVASCTPGTDNNQVVTTCSTANTGPTQLTPGTTCNSQAPSAANGWVTTTCVASDTSPGVASCTPSAPGVLPIVTCNTVTTPPTLVTSCDSGTDSTFLTTTCATTTSDPIRTTSCTPVAASPANNYQTTNCVPIQGTMVQTNTETTTTSYTVSGPNSIASSAKLLTTVDSGWMDGSVCYVPPQLPPVIDTSPGWKQSTTGMPTGCTAWPCPGAVDANSAVVGSSNSLADVAQYYYVTDLRPSPVGVSPDPWANNVPKLGSGIEDDRAPWQHMTTFVLGLGVSGTLNFQSDYKSAQSGDFTKIRSYTNSPALNWPVWPPNPTSPTAPPMGANDYNDARSIDDFWHTAVNGRGTFFSASDPDAVVKGLTQALAGIAAQAGAGTGAATSTLSPVQGDNTAYIGSYTTSEWTGELRAESIDLTTGALSGTVLWSGRSLLDLKTGNNCDNRTIWTKDPASTALVPFTMGTKTCDSNLAATGTASSSLPTSLQAYFTNAAVIGSTDPTVGLSQYPTMSSSQRSAALGANLVNFIRGQRGSEGYLSGDGNPLYRKRTHILGDIVDSQPNYVKAPSLSYQDAGYSDFVTANATRTPMVYVGANDGMMHAFYAPSKSTDANYAKAGQEAWAYIPTAVMPQLYKLADFNYSSNHIFTVDGSVISGDIYDATAKQWKTIIVGGLNAGGKGYYALDVTDGTAPKALWEFNNAAGCSGTLPGESSDCNLGLTFGRPIITKLKTGQWVVMFTSGYNNITGSGDGGGYLYVVDAVTGKLVTRISTLTGSVGAPSGLREINYYVNNVAYDNTALQVYGTDILGNIWRFGINDTTPAAVLVGTAKDPSGNPQPITTRPELSEVNNGTMIFVGTGKLLSLTDLADTSVQTIYGIKDPLIKTSPEYNDLRAALTPMKLTQSGTGTSVTRTTTCAGATVTDCSAQAGWYIDLPDGGERANIDVTAVLGTLVFATNVPSSAACLAGGYSWLNYVNLVNGQPVASSVNGVASVPFFSDALVVGVGFAGINGGIKAQGTSQGGGFLPKPVPVGSPPPIGKRISWREITQ